MVSSGKRAVMEYRCLRRFRRRRLLAFLRRSNLSATFDALKHETRVFLDVRFLRRLVVDGRWHEARGYITRFLPRQDDQMGVEAHTVLRFMDHLNVLDDLAQGKLRQMGANPSTMADPHYAEVVRTIFNTRSHPAQRDSLDWQLVRHNAAEIVKDLVTQIPQFSHLLRLPRCPINPCYTIPFGFWGRRRHHRKNIDWMPSSLLAHCFLPKERRLLSPRNQGFSPRNQGLLSKPMAWLEAIIDETLLAGDQEVKDHSLADSCSEGISGAPVVSYIVTKHLSQEDCYVESDSGAKHRRATMKCPQILCAMEDKLA